MEMLLSTQQQAPASQPTSPPIMVPPRHPLMEKLEAGMAKETAVGKKGPSGRNFWKCGLKLNTRKYFSQRALSKY